LLAATAVEGERKRDLGASNAASGFRKAVLYNAHGGNTSLVEVLARVDELELLKPEGSSTNFGWLTKGIAPSGVTGDPSAATAENGERWSREAAGHIAQILMAMYNFEPRHGA
jgi:creatinine amidohydrolase/Fe(II)-dependent formamide hydrolase-like protein